MVYPPDPLAGVLTCRCPPRSYTLLAFGYWVIFRGWNACRTLWGGLGESLPPLLLSQIFTGTRIPPPPPPSPISSSNTFTHVSSRILSFCRIPHSFLGHCHPTPLWSVPHNFDRIERSCAFLFAMHMYIHSNGRFF